jgi:hypothetical protein
MVLGEQRFAVRGGWQVLQLSPKTANGTNAKMYAAARQADGRSEYQCGLLHMGDPRNWMARQRN